MRVYHFTNAMFGLEDIRLRRLKVARIADLNDPFELMAPTFEKSDSRASWLSFRRQADLEIGLLCFSRSWRNPVQWSHYADRHRGLCLGFDVPDEKVLPVRYLPKRIKPNFLKIVFHQSEEQEFFRSALYSKFSHWNYEQEIRWVKKLSEADESEGNFFFPFSHELQLQEVIVGANSDISRATLTKTLGKNVADVKCKKARLAFKTFRVVEQRKATLWL